MNPKFLILGDFNNFITKMKRLANKHELNGSELGVIRVKEQKEDGAIDIK